MTLNKSSKNEIGELLIEGSTSLNVIEWQDFLFELGAILKRKNQQTHYWKATVENFGWDNRFGFKFFEASSPEEFIKATLPPTDCRFYIFDYGCGLALECYHHDSPVGNEWYFLTPVSESEYEQSQSMKKVP